MQTQDEQLSLLIDEELEASSARRLLDRMAEDRELAAAWRRYHLVRQCMRGEQVALADDGFVAAVSRRLAAEPPPAPARPPHYRLDWLRPASGLALAASVAALAIAAVRGYGVDQWAYPLGNWVTATGAAGVQQAGSGALSPEKLNDYMVMHSEGVYSAGAGDMLPQARVVSFVSP